MDRKALEARLAELAKRITPEATSEELDTLGTEIDEARAQLEAIDVKVAKANEMRARLRTDGISRPEPEPEDKRETGEKPEVLDRRSVVDAFVSSPDVSEYRSYRLGTRSQGGIQIDGIEARALIGNTAANVLDPTPRIPGLTVSVVEDRPPRLADLLTTVRVTGDSMAYVRDNSPSPQGAATEVAEGAEKPEATYTWELITDTIKTVAHWMDISRQALDDHQQLRDLVQGRLFYGLSYRVDGQIANGTGASNTMTGILNTAGINTYDTGLGNDEARIISLRRAKTLVRADEYMATAAVLNPDDWEKVELSTDDMGRWRVTPNVQDNLSPRIWGMTVVDTTSIAAGTALIGDFRLGATLYDRMAAALYVTDSDASKFRSNILTLLAELRLGLGVNRPSAFAKITFRGSE